MAEAQSISPKVIEPPRRAILLGASNLTRSLATVVPTAEHVWGSPLEVLAALGHGRSYGMTSRVLGRSLLGIKHCGLWESLDRSPPAPTAALITDVGNDLLYGAAPELILEWVAECFDRLASRSARTTITLLPIASTAAMSDWFYFLLRTCTYPKCRLSRSTVLERAEKLNAGLKLFAAARGAACVELSASWYGLDPIHIRRGAWQAAWSTILGAWSETPTRAPRSRGSLRRWLDFKRLAPEKKWHFGREFTAIQPAARLRSGTTIALY